MEPLRPKPPFHIPSLDGIRAVSIMIVYLAHAGLSHLIPGGFGVTVFFFLSGFLISTLLRREFANNGRISFKNFYLRRVLRIFPPFYTALALSIVLLAVGALPGVLDWGGIAWLALHAGNYLQVLEGTARIPAGTGVYWSLAVEEHYYLTYPLLALFLLRRNDRRLSAVVLTLVGILVLGWRIYLVEQGVSEDRTYLASDTRVDSILWGCLLAMSYNPLLDPPARMGATGRVLLLVVAFAVLLGCLVYRDPAFRETYRYTLQGLALLPIFYIAIANANWPVFRWLEWKAVRHIGVLSYSLYLIHHVLLYSGEHLAPAMNTWLRGALVLVLCLVLSQISLRYMEQPVANLRKRYR